MYRQKTKAFRRSKSSERLLTKDSETYCCNLYGLLFKKFRTRGVGKGKIVGGIIGV
mgnify:FL=1